MNPPYSEIKTEAKRLGFSILGFSELSPPAHFYRYARWIETGNHGEMAYLSRPDSVNLRKNPEFLFRGAVSLISLGIKYEVESAAQPAEGEGYIAWFSRYLDYHKLLPRTIMNALESISVLKNSQKWITVDSSPVLEREFGANAGLGWIGKNSNLISPQDGSFFFLAEAFVDKYLPFVQSPAIDHCGTCERCIQACPGRCIRSDRTVDARRCIAYLTIEKKGIIPVEYRPVIGNHLFGCDLCQRVCPWNLKKTSEAVLSEFRLEKAINFPKIAASLVMDETEFIQKYAAYPLQRAKWEGWLRNCCIVAGNQKNPQYFPGLSSLLINHPSIVVRAHAAWAIGKIPGKNSRDLLSQVFSKESSQIVCDEIKAALTAAS